MNTLAKSEDLDEMRNDMRFPNMWYVRPTKA